MSEILIGQRFGKLRALLPSTPDKRNRPRWDVECDCGNLRAVLAASLTSGNSTSCGCSRKDSCGRYDRTGTRRRPPETPTDAASKVCARCGKEKSADEFGRRGPSASGGMLFRSTCKTCEVEKTLGYTKKRRDADPIREWARRSLVEIGKRCRRFSIENRISIEEIISCAGNGACAYCGVKVTFIMSDNKMLCASIDQIVPRGGYNPTNVVMCCYRCNSRKGDCCPDELRKIADSVDELIRTRGLKQQ